MKNTLIKSAIGVLLALASFSSSQADTLIETASLGSASSPVAFSSNGTFTVAGFNPSLGTLTGVSINLTLNLTAFLEAINLNSTPATFTNASATFDYSLTGPGNATYISAPGTNAPLVSSLANTGTLYTANPGVNSYAEVQATLTANPTITAAQFSSFEGTGPVDLTFASTNGTYSMTGALPANGTVLVGGNGTTYITGDVTYTYTATPEPATCALLVGSLGLLFWRLRARRS